MSRLGCTSSIKYCVRQHQCNMRVVRVGKSHVALMVLGLAYRNHQALKLAMDAASLRFLQGPTVASAAALQVVRPQAIADLVHAAEELRIAPPGGGHAALPTPNNCTRCGYISSQDVCKACLLLEGLNKGQPSLGVTRHRAGKQMPQPTSKVDLNVDASSCPVLDERTPQEDLSEGIGLVQLHAHPSAKRRTQPVSNAS